MLVIKELRDCLLFEIDHDGAKRVAADSYRRYFLPRVKIANYNVEIDGRNFYDQPISDWIKQYDEVRKVSTRQGNYYTTGCLLDFAYFKNNYRLIAADLSKQKDLDADSRAIQQIIFTGRADAGAMIYYILEQSKETTLQFSKETTKVLWIIWMIEYSKVNVKWSDTQLKKLKSVVKKKRGTTLRMSLKMLDGNDLPHELLLTTRQKNEAKKCI